MRFTTPHRPSLAGWGLGLLLLFSNVANVTAVDGSISLGEAAQALPSCALTCLASAISNSTCEAADVDCICANGPLNDAATVCIMGACSVKESLVAKNNTHKLCGAQETTEGEVIPVFAVFLSLALVAVALRMVARLLTKAYFWWDDGCNFIALFGLVAFGAINIKSVVYGYGMNIWLLPFDNVTTILQLFFANMLLYTATRFFIRASIILFYIRVFPSDQNKNLRSILYYTMIFNVAYNLGFFFAVLFQCTPIHFFWDQWDGEHVGHCGNVNLLAWVAAITGILFDVWLLALPFPQLMALNLHWKKKVMGSIMFSMGACVIVISLIRLKTINQFTRAVNPSKDIVQLCLWSDIELAIGVICPCLPSFRLMLRRLLPRIMGTSGRFEMDRVTGTAATGTGAGGSKHMSRSVSKGGGLQSIVKTTSIGIEFTNGRESARHGDSSASVTALFTDSDEESGNGGGGRMEGHSSHGSHGDGLGHAGLGVHGGGRR
ncbi:hypothetical protein B0T17DRAFT_593740 [Bombardia bombarda]|uniref:CFEM domain-containing protein n=1 Tax=Bombardia bombarda TaxID=252184 RepID=A0AA39U1R9_9PEZI|nr:hypothetical protein B0T17DRAFT_593740 [Bombardia bombarda]